jgi:SNF2 family DNA or RNA helicase
MFNLTTKLLPHQTKAVNKFNLLRGGETKHLKVAGLFMEMGTGKTLSAIEMVRQRGDKISKVIWCCPVSIKETIKKEILKHTDQSPTDIYLFDEKTGTKKTPDAFWYIVGLESISQSDRVAVALYSLIDADSCVIVDESSFIANHKSKRAERLSLFAKKARFRFILTGTPLSNGIVSLYSQMKFLSPKILDYMSFYSFANNNLVYSERYPGMIESTLNEEYLAVKIAPYVYQVTKDECLDLPPKVYDTHYFRMSGEQREAYESAKMEFLEMIDPTEFSAVDIFKLFQALQQIVSGYRNIDTKKPIYFDDSYRVDALEDVLNSIPNDKKVLIWAKYHYDLKLIREALGDEAVYYSGLLNEKQKEATLDEWRESKRYLVATQASGGFGLTLTEAHYAVFYNNSFSYSKRVQAEDRCHRIGQNEKVTYIDICCSDSIDERIMGAIWDKKSVADSFRDEINNVKDDESLAEFVKSL